MKNTILKQVNDVGAVLGYPFYVYPDGTCGKSIVSGDLKAVIEVNKRFPVKMLKSEFVNYSLEDEDRDILMYLSKIGENIGFPFYVYYNGTCGVSPCMQSGNFPFIMKVNEKIEVKQVVGTFVLSEKEERVDDEVVDSPPVFVKTKEPEVPKKPKVPKEPKTVRSKAVKSNHQSGKNVVTETDSRKMDIGEKCSEQKDKPNPCNPSANAIHLLEQLRNGSLKADGSDELRLPQVLKSLEWAVVRFGNVEDLKKYCAISDLSDEGREYLISRENQYLLKVYVCAFEFKGPALKWLLKKCDEDVIMAYLQRHPIVDEDALRLLVHDGSDRLLMAYWHQYPLSSDMMNMILLKRSDELILSGLEEGIFADMNMKGYEILFTKRNDCLVKAFVQKYELSSDAQCLMITRRSEDVVLAYVEKHELADLAQILMLQRCHADTVLAYIHKYELFFLAQVLMVAKLEDDITKTYIEKYKLCEEAQTDMIQKCSAEVVQIYRKRHGLSMSCWWNMCQKYGLFWFTKPC